MGNSALALRIVLVPFLLPLDIVSAGWDCGCGVALRVWFAGAQLTASAMPIDSSCRISELLNTLGFYD